MRKSRYDVPILFWRCPHRRFEHSAGTCRDPIGTSSGANFLAMGALVLSPVIGVFASLLAFTNFAAGTVKPLSIALRRSTSSGAFGVNGQVILDSWGNL
jgi:hypothetical protein